MATASKAKAAPKKVAPAKKAAPAKSAAVVKKAAVKAAPAKAVAKAAPVADFVKITKVIGRQILDSRGNPTVEVDITLDNGFVARAAVPSGASTGEFEACELRDGNKKVYLGKGVLKAVEAVNGPIAKLLKGKNPLKQRELDDAMIALDGTANKSKLGANALLGASMAITVAAANVSKMPVWKYIAKLHKNKEFSLPTPMANIINGGKHADNMIDFQEFMIMPVGAKTFSEGLQWITEVFHALKSILKKGGHVTAVGDEGGFAPNLTNDQALEVVMEAIKAADEGAGVFMVIKNYSGDIMNFEIAQELAEMEGIEVASVIVDDDIAVENSLYTQGRRGVAGTILVHKILGHAATTGKSLAEIKELADRLVPQIKTIGLALSGATVPEVGKPGFVLEEDEFEYGVGIHGEPGYKKEKLQPSAKLAEELVEKLAEGFDIQDGEHYGVLINGLGATPLMEQYVFANDVAQLLAKKGVVVDYKKIGNYMTSIDMAGLSLTLIKLEDPSWIDALQAPVEVVAW